MNKDSLLILRVEGNVLRGHIKAAAAGDDAVKAVKEAEKRNVRLINNVNLINVEDAAESSAALMINLLH